MLMGMTTRSFVGEGFTWPLVVIAFVFGTLGLVVAFTVRIHLYVHSCRGI